MFLWQALRLLILLLAGGVRCLFHQSHHLRKDHNAAGNQRPPSYLETRLFCRAKWHFDLPSKKQPLLILFFFCTFDK